MIAAFDFEDGGRMYTCSVEQARATRTEAWWWFGVSGDRQRYAPFRAGADDTQDSVRWRIVSFYGDLLTRRAMPAARYRWGYRSRESNPRN